jgi:hypothetical protein
LAAISGERDDVGEVGLWLRSVGPDQEEDAPADEADEDLCVRRTLVWFTV